MSFWRTLFPRRPRIHADDIDLHRISYACPEQYDAFHKGEQVGYLRLRHGDFTVECPDVNGDMVLETSLMVGDGCFRDSERERFLDMAKEAIAKWVER